MVDFRNETFGTLNMNCIVLYVHNIMNILVKASNTKQNILTQSMK